MACFFGELAPATRFSLGQRSPLRVLRLPRLAVARPNSPPHDAERPSRSIGGQRERKVSKVTLGSLRIDPTQSFALSAEAKLRPIVCNDHRALNLASLYR